MDRLPGFAAGGRDRGDRLASAELDGVRVDGGGQGGQVLGGGLGDDGHDLEAGTRRGGITDDPGERGGLVDLQHSWGAWREVQTDRVGAGPDGRERASRISHAADLHEWPARDVGRILRLPTGRHE